MDALNRVIDSLRLKATQFFRSELMPSQGVLLSSKGRCAFHIIEQGQCWLRVKDQPDLIVLDEGDLIVMNDQQQYAILGAPDAPVVLLDPYAMLPAVTTTKNDHSTFIISSMFEAKHNGLYPFISLLPRLLHIRSKVGSNQDWLTTGVKFISIEMKQQKPGYETIIERLMDVIFIMVLRNWIEDYAGNDRGWLGALYHPQLGPVLGYIHSMPEQDWSVSTLAQQVNMSRSNLATQFTKAVGESPMKYLTRWRMQRASMLLLDNPDMPLNEIATQVGYSSPFIFSRAFKRYTGLSPRHYREQNDLAGQPIKTIGATTQDDPE